MNLQVLNGFLMLMLRGGTLALPLITLPVLSRALGPAGMGAIAFAQSLGLSLGAIVDFGFNITAVRSVALARASGNEVSEIFWSIGAARLGLLGGALCLLLAVIFFSIDDPTTRSTGICAVMLLVGTMLTPTWLFYALDRGPMLLGTTLLCRLLGLAGILLFVREGDVVDAARILFGAEMLAGLVCFFTAWRLIGKRRPTISWTTLKREVKAASQASVGICASGAAEFSTGYLTTTLCGPAQMGVFSAADRLVKAAASCVWMFLSAFQAQATKQYDRSPTLGKKYTRRMAIGVTGGAILIGAGVVIFAPKIIELVFGNQFEESVPVLRLAVLSLPPMAMAVCFGTLGILAEGRFVEYARIRIWHSCFHVLVAWPMISLFGPLGSAGVLVISNAVLGLMILFLYRRRTADRERNPFAVLYASLFGRQQDR